MNLLIESHKHESAAAGGASSTWRELASRRSGGITVGLYWRPLGDEVSVHVSDEATGESFVLEPPKGAALAAFYHPYAHKELSTEGAG
jgi:hypothetical protein